MWRTLIGSLIFLATLIIVMVRPVRISEAVAASCGAALMLLGGYLLPKEAVLLLAARWNVFGFLLGLMAISALADQAGLFETVAFRAGQWGRGSGLRLYIAVFASGAVITAFLSNDATALILTPLVYALVTRLRLPVLPFLLACTFIADTASFILPFSNPINILVIDAFGGTLSTFLHYLLLPALFCIVLNTILFTWLFRADLRLSYDQKLLKLPRMRHRGFFRFTLIALGVIALGYLAASLMQVPLSLVALGGSLLLLAGAAWCRCLDWKRLRNEISWSLFVFVGAMFLLVHAVENLGLTASFGGLLAGHSGSTSLSEIIRIAGGTALGANLINNVPMTLVMISALGSVHGPESLRYAAILGADLGPNLTTVGSLATMLWLMTLRRKGLEISRLQYFKLGITIVPIMLLVGSLLIWLRL